MGFFVFLRCARWPVTRSQQYFWVIVHDGDFTVSCTGKGFRSKKFTAAMVDPLKRPSGLKFEGSSYTLQTYLCHYMQLDQQIQHIHQKLQQLLKRHAALQKEKEQLQSQLTSLQSEHAQQTQSIELLQQKVQVLQAAKGEMNDEEKKAFEKRLSQYIREIDRCIAMLSE